MPLPGDTNEGKISIKEGSFSVTAHINIPTSTTLVVYHVKIEDTSIKLPS